MSSICKRSMQVFEKKGNNTAVTFRESREHAAGVEFASAVTRSLGEKVSQSSAPAPCARHLAQCAISSYRRMASLGSRFAHSAEREEE